jgi:hypothetical protein
LSSATTGPACAEMSLGVLRAEGLVSSVLFNFVAVDIWDSSADPQVARYFVGTTERRFGSVRAPAVVAWRRAGRRPPAAGKIRLASSIFFLSKQPSKSKSPRGP